MLPDNLVSTQFHITDADEHHKNKQNDRDTAKDQMSFADIEKAILFGGDDAKCSRNMLFEEHDHHIKERIIYVIKIETFASVLNSLIMEKEITTETVSELLNEKTRDVNQEGQAIWLNLMTREKKTPFFYQFED